MKTLSPFWLLAVLALCVPSSRPLQAQDEVSFLERLQVGHWVELRGSWRGSRFVAERIEVRRPRSATRLWGRAQTSPEGELVVLDRLIRTDVRTGWPDGSLEDARGRRVRVLGSVDRRGRIFAERVEIREDGVDRIEGRIDRMIPQGDGGLTLQVLGFEIDVPSDVRQRLERPWESLTLAPSGARRTYLPGGGDMDDLLGDGYQLSQSLNVALRQSLSFGSRDNFELDETSDLDEDDEDRADTAHDLRSRWTWSPSSGFFGVADLRHQYRERDEAGSPARAEDRFQLSELYAIVPDIGFGIGLQAGRQDFDEPREWVYDQNLDGLRLFRPLGRSQLELSLTTTLDGGSSRDRDATNTILYWSTLPSRNRYSAYVVHRDFGSERGERQTHWGVRAQQRWGRSVETWLDLAHLDGFRAQRPVRAWGGDAGLRWRPRRLDRFTLSLGFAHGSGGEEGAVDHRFRQTGLQDNNARLSGVSTVRYYGELLDPELSNLRISTASLAIRLARRSTLELVYHDYTQHKPARRLTNTNIDRRPDGLSDDLGSELDLILAVRRWRRWDLELVAARFEQGLAFPDGDDASMLKAEIRYRY